MYRILKLNESEDYVKKQYSMLKNELETIEDKIANSNPEDDISALENRKETLIDKIDNLEFAHPDLVESAEIDHYEKCDKCGKDVAFYIDNTTDIVFDGEHHYCERCASELDLLESTLNEANSKTVKEYRIIDTGDNNKVLKTFKAEDYEKGYNEMRQMGEELKKAGKEDNLIYKEYTVKNNLTEAPDEEEIEQNIEDDIEANEELEDTIDSEENQEENPVEEESDLDVKLDELREVLVDLDLNLYRIASKEDKNNVIYVIGKVAEESNDVLMLIDTEPEEINEPEIEEPEIEEPIIDNITTDEEVKEIKEAYDKTNYMKQIFDEEALLQDVLHQLKTNRPEYKYELKKDEYNIPHIHVYGDSLYKAPYVGISYIDKEDFITEYAEDSLQCHTFSSQIFNNYHEDIIEPITNSNEFINKVIQLLDDLEDRYKPKKEKLTENEKKLETPEESEEEELKTPEQRFDFIVLPKSFDEINKLNPRYGEELTPDHEAIMDYLMNCLIEVNPEAAEELQKDDTEEDLPVPANPEDIDLDINIDGEEDLEDED